MRKQDHSEKLSADFHISPVKRFGRAALGLGMLASVAAGGAMLASETLEIDEKVVELGVDNAQPTDDLANIFDTAVLAGSVLGAGFIAKRGLRKMRLAYDDKEDALNSMAHAEFNRSNRLARVAAPASLLVAGAGLMTGNFVDVAEEVSSSQSDVTPIFTSIFGQGEGDTFIISNTPEPELANNNNISQEQATQVLADEQDEVMFIPGNWEWHSGYRPGSTGKVQLLTASLPHEVARLPLASEDCSDLSAAVAREFGLREGDTFNLDGLRVRVRSILKDSAGLNLIPVIFNNEDFARCIRNNPEQAFSMMLAQGEKNDIENILSKHGLSAESLDSRAFVVPTSELSENSQQTGDNSVNPLVLQAMLVASLFAGASLSGRARNRIIENRRINAVWEANGTTKKNIAKKYAEIAESEVTMSSALAAPAIVLLDAYTNGGIPGADVAPSLKTFLCVVGVNWGIIRIGTSIAVRREAQSTNLGKGHLL